MEKRKNSCLILIISLVVIVLFLLYFIFFLKIEPSKFFVFFISIFIFIVLFYGFLIVFLVSRKIFSNIKSELKVLNRKEKAVKDIYMYEQFLNPPDIVN